MPLFLLIRDCQKNFQSMQAVDFFHALREGGGAKSDSLISVHS